MAGLCVEEIHAITRDFVGCASRLERAGFNAVEIHAGNGYLFQQFLSPRVNHRDDAYGGPLENRMRLLLETVTAIRDALPTLPLLVRISASECAERGYAEGDIVTLARALERAARAGLCPRALRERDGSLRGLRRGRSAEGGRVNPGLIY